MQTVASQPLAAVSRHPKRPPALSVGPAAPCPCLLPCCTPAMLPTEALIAKESQGEGLGSLMLQLRCLPVSRERPECFFSAPGSRFGFPGMRSSSCAGPTSATHPTGSLQQQPQHPHALVPPSKPLPPWREAKAISGAQTR